MRLFIYASYIQIIIFFLIFVSKLFSSNIPEEYLQFISVPENQEGLILDVYFFEKDFVGEVTFEKKKKVYKKLKLTSYFLYSKIK